MMGSESFDQSIRSAGVLLLALLDGATFANALRSNGRPCRIRLPDDPGGRMALVEAHLRGAPSILEFHADGHSPWCERVNAVALAAFCPGADGRCRWLAMDVDAADHGPSGLADPVHAARTIAERASHHGLLSGLLVARSRGGIGRHLFLIPPEPVALDDAVIAVASLAADAFKVADTDVDNYGAPHAFRRLDAVIAQPGDSGAVELFPRSTVKPTYGWALALPAAGAFRPNGGVIVDPFTDRPVHHDFVPRCTPEAWSQFITEARNRVLSRGSDPLVTRLQDRASKNQSRIDHIDHRTRSFLDGQAQQGTRNQSAFAASANLLGCGVDELEARRIILAGAAACALPEREAVGAFNSAVRTVAARRGGL